MMSIDTATPQDWNKVTAKYVEPYDMPPKEDLVNSPSHYLEGSIKKYLHRYRYKKKPVEDLRKARWYLDRLIAEEVRAGK
jgi:hypothetical protein